MPHTRFVGCAEQGQPLGLAAAQQSNTLVGKLLKELQKPVNGWNLISVFEIGLILISHKNTKLGDAQQSLRTALVSAHSWAHAGMQGRSTGFSIVRPQVRRPTSRLHPLSPQDQRGWDLCLTGAGSHPAERWGQKRHHFVLRHQLNLSWCWLPFFLTRPGVSDRCGQYKEPEDKGLKS